MNTMFKTSLFCALLLLVSCATIKKLSEDFQKEMDRQKALKQQQEQTAIQTNPTPNNTETAQAPKQQTTTAPKQQTKSSLFSEKEIKDFLDFHNKARKEVGTPPLEWSEELAQYAQEWANYISQLGVLKHREVFTYGENCAMTGGGNWQLVDGAKLWYTEKSKYKGQVLTGSNWSIAGHYTQMVWRTSTTVGAGRATNAQGQTYIVANYNPPGNYTGQKAY